MTFVAFLKDSLRETMDKKSFWVLGILAIIFVLFCFSISFEKMEPKEALNGLVERFNRVVGGSGQDMSSHRFWELDFEADEICLLYTSPSPRDATLSRMPSSA